jgi:hypothetical protein
LSKAVVELLRTKNERIGGLERVLTDILKKLEISALPQERAQDGIGPRYQKTYSSQRGGVHEISQAMFPTTALFDLYRDQASRIVVEVKDVLELDRRPDTVRVPVVSLNKMLDEMPRAMHQSSVFIDVSPIYSERSHRYVHSGSVCIATFPSKCTPLDPYLII